MKESKLTASIPANNQKIIEIYQKLQTQKLNKAPDYQRKKVWRRQHKIEFINTILLNYPFPEVYIAPEKVDTKRLELTEQIVDGQQRLTTIQAYINSEDVFAQPTSIPHFNDLNEEQKEDFLNYEISVRYLKNANTSQIKEIFQRINRTDYALNKMERFHAIWGESELVCLAKQAIERDLEINLESVEYIIPNNERDWLLRFFVSTDVEAPGLFTDSEISRMMSLQFMLVLLTSLISGSYFHRNSGIEPAVQSFNDSVPDAHYHIDKLVKTTKLIDEMNLGKNSIWMLQSSLLNLICEIAKFEIDKIKPQDLESALKKLEHAVDPSTDSEWRTYVQYTKEAVNEKRARVFRGDFIGKIIHSII